MTRKMTHTLLRGVAAAALATASTAAYAQTCDWTPDRAVTYVVPWGAGGGTDANSRMLATMLEQKWGVPFNVVNRTGGNGVTGHSAISNAAPDGYTVGAVTVEINTMHWVGLTDMTHENIAPIALIDIVPASVLVGHDSPFETLEDLMAHARANPGELTASGTSLGGIWHLALAGMLNAEGMDPEAIRWIPSQGAAPAMQELIAGGVDIATPALSEGRALVEAGEIRALAYMHDSPMEALPDVPVTSEVLESGWTLAAYITISGPEGLPDEISCAYEQAVNEITQSAEWAEFKASRGADVVFMGREELTEFMVAQDTALGETIQAIGLAE
ncbi:tripartite tricarboxylate transporter substrate binding protein [Roseinatronobacter alkalisoli]|uniref:Tripartite tricarboxylate transporter substrate binding protein n=1 Tax=Roseinatronobacter alkalisoli TaxID=3028235 RepID=A0ABT5TC76_9RHOB|nr:tripartite tricarboxylate transporter substrate binding protein [Roseinatronobacter sp. HJB301]MDD7972699.1 tripartite tricarboxylate transporter substrate binding protein [Roseinatronobacter sp. HJB301]